jgi:ribonuclease III
MIELSENRLIELENIIGYKFTKTSLLLESLSHPSLKHKKLKKNFIRSYERMEFLGDSILNCVITNFLYNRYDFQEGQLAKIRSSLICKDTICKVAMKLNLSQYIIMTYGEENSGGRNNLNNIENVMESLIAAVFLDSDFITVRNFITRLWHEFIGNIDLIDYDPKTNLQELTQNKFHIIPSYKVIKKNEATHESYFMVTIEIANNKSYGEGHSIKEAEKDAARKMLQILQCENNIKISDQ